MWEMLSLNQRYWLVKVKYSKFSILNIARGEKTQVVQYIGGASKKWKLKGFYWPICSSWKLLEMYKLDIQNWFVHSVCYTDSWSHERERERILLSLTGCSHRCRHQQVWIHSSLEVKPKQNWTPWYTEMPIPLTPHAPASHTNQSHKECEPPLQVWISTAYETQPLFPDFGAVWGGKCFGVNGFPAGCSANHVLAVSVGKAWVTLRGINSRGRYHANVCSETLQMPLPGHNPSPATQDYPQLMTGDRVLLISGLLHQPGVISQQAQSFSFCNLKWNSPFSRASHFTPIFFVCLFFQSCSH